MDKKFAIGITIGAALSNNFNGVVKGTKREMDALGSTLDGLDKKKKLLQKFEVDSAQLERAKQKAKELGAELQKSRNQMRSRDSNMAGIQAAIASTTASMKTASKEQQKGYRESLQLLKKQLQIQTALPEKMQQQRAELRNAVTLQTRITQQVDATKKAITASGMSVTNLKSQYDRLAVSVNKVEQSEARRAKMGRIGQGLATGAVAVAAGAAVLARPAKAALGYEYRMANLANTAYAGESLEDRKRGMQEMRTGIQTANREGGGTRESAADTLDTLVASGAFGDGKEGIQKSLTMLPGLMKAATASGSDATELAQIAIAASRFKIAEKDLPKALDMAMRAGQMGGFELRDMAKWLPQQMAAGRQSGLSGIEGFGLLITVNQASRTTAGTTDEAGNNVVNWLTKINSDDTKKDVKKTLGINLPEYLAEQRGKCVDSMAAFAKLIDQVASKDKQYNLLQQRAANEKDGDKRNTVEQMANILQGSAVGKLIQDRQALMGLLGYINNTEYMANIQKNVDGNAAVGTAQDSYDLLKTTGQFNVEQLNNEKINAQDTAFSQLTPAINGLATTMVDLAREYPVMTTSVVAATTGLTALAAAAGGGALMQMLMMRGAGGRTGAGTVVAATVKTGIVKNLISKLPGTAAATQAVKRVADMLPASVATAGTSSVVGKAVGMAKRVPLLGVGLSALEATNVARSETLSASKKKVEISGIAGGAIGGIAGGAATGAMIGSIVPGVGTLLGGIVGGILGSFAGDKIGRSIAERIVDQTPKAKAPIATVPATVGGIGAATPTTIEKKTSLEAKYTINANGVGMVEVNEMIKREIAMLQAQQEARLRAAMHDGGD